MADELKAKFSIELDGQEATMIISALLEQGERCSEPARRIMNRILATRIAEGKQQFHAAAGAVLSRRYNIPS